MIQQAPRADPFKEQLRESLQRETFDSRTVKIARHANVYTCGDRDETVYFIESGRIKLLMLSPEGRECLFAIHSAGDIFGELCLSGSGARLETATAMEETILEKIPSSQFLARLSRDSLLEGYVRYLAVRVAEQQQVIADLVTVDSQQRLGKTLLHLARTLGKRDRESTRIELKISHEELSEMVGTTRPRISLFMQRFRNLGLIEIKLDHFLVVNEKKLTGYLNSRAAGHVFVQRDDTRQHRPVLGKVICSEPAWEMTFINNAARCRTTTGGDLTNGRLRERKEHGNERENRPDQRTDQRGNGCANG